MIKNNLEILLSLKQTIHFAFIIFQSILRLSKGHCKATTARGIVHHYCGTLAKARSNSTLGININYYIKCINTIIC